MHSNVLSNEFLRPGVCGSVRGVGGVVTRVRMWTSDDGDDSDDSDELGTIVTIEIIVTVVW